MQKDKTEVRCFMEGRLKVMSVSGQSGEHRSAINNRSATTVKTLFTEKQNLSFDPSAHAVSSASTPDSLAAAATLRNDFVMEILRRAAEALASRNPLRRRILVPTMGALHRGHGQLIRIAREEAGEGGEVAVSIFVNPLQFAPGGDYEKYPRPEEADDEFCRNAGVDILFRPTVEEMYPADFSVSIEETSLANVLEGKSRPGHFSGVCTVVAKLFHLLSPDAAVFGQKDFQQLAIIRRMVRDLNFPIEIIGVPTVREADGLACSSRNQYLNAAEREAAPVLQRALQEARVLVGQGEKSAEAIAAAARKTIAAASLARIDYLEIVNAETLQPTAEVGPDSLIAVAAFFGQTRLIDNLRLA
jgi:pantoate--beta-alanine ligase